MTELVNQPKIYVACLAAYNNGILYGAWIDANQEPEALQQAVIEMLKRSPMPNAEEWEIHGYDSFYNVTISEFASLETVSKYARFIEEHGKLGALLLEHFGGDADDAKFAMTECYFGEYKRLEDFAEESISNSETIPNRIAYYIDYEAMARDWEISGDIYTLETGFEEIHVFGTH